VSFLTSVSLYQKLHFHGAYCQIFTLLVSNTGKQLLSEELLPFYVPEIYVKFSSLALMDWCNEKALKTYVNDGASQLPKVVSLTSKFWASGFKRCMVVQNS